MSNSHKNILQEYCQKQKYSMPSYQTNSSGQAHALSWSATITLVFDNETLTAASTIPFSKASLAEQQAAQLMYEKLTKDKRKSDNTYLNRKNSNVRDISNIAVGKETQPRQEDFIGYPCTQRKAEIVDTPQLEVLNPVITGDFIDTITKVYIIDLENKPCFNKSLQSNHSLYIGFISSTHHSVPKYANWYHSDTDDVMSLVNTSQNNKLLFTIDGGLTDLVDHSMSMFIYPLLAFIKKLGRQINIVIVTGDNAGWCTAACLRTAIKWHNMELISRVTNSITIE